MGEMSLYSILDRELIEQTQGEIVVLQQRRIINELNYRSRVRLANTRVTCDTTALSSDHSDIDDRC